METRSIVRGVRLSADKGRLVADLVRGRPVDQALNILTLVMASWKKVKPARLRYTLLMLERLLSSNGLD